MLIWKFRALYLLVGLSLGVFNPYISVLLTHDGMSDSAVGLLMAVGMLVGMALQPMWGVVADRFGRVRLLLAIAFFLPVCVVMLFDSKAFVVLLAANAAYFLAKTPHSSMADAYVLRATAGMGPVYGVIRFFQSIGFGVGGYLAGYYIGTYTAATLWLLAAAVGIVGALVILWLPESEIGRSSYVRGELFYNIRQLMSRRNKNFLLFLLGTFFLNQTLAAFNTYLVIAYADYGGSMHNIGLAFLIASAANIPSMYFGQRLIEKFGGIRTIMLASTLYLARWLLLWFVTSPAWIIAIQVLHGSFGLFFVPAVHYVVEHSAEQIRATAQTIFGMIAVGLAGIVGNVLNGFLIQAGGPGLMYLVCAASVLLAFGCFGYIAVSERQRRAVPTVSM